MRTLWIAGSLCRKEVVHVYIHKYTHAFIILPKKGFSTQTGGSHGKNLLNKFYAVLFDQNLDC